MYNDKEKIKMTITKQEFLENIDDYTNFAIEKNMSFNIDFGNHKIVEAVFKPTIPQIDREERARRLQSLMGIIKDPVLSNLSDKEIKELIIEERIKKYETND
jgi:hypothetical protein